jgi:hypothetical protein
MSFLLPIAIQTRREANLELITLKNTAAPNKFIIPVDTATALPIISIDKNEILKAIIGGGKDESINKLKIIPKVTSTGISFTINPKEGGENDDVKEEPLANSIDMDAPMQRAANAQHVSNENEVINNIALVTIGEQYTIYFTETIEKVLLYGQGNWNALNIHGHTLGIKFEYEFLNEKYTNEIEIHLATTSAFVNVALDFGSEASQVAVQKYVKQAEHIKMDDVNYPNLFKLIKNYCRTTYSLVLNDDATYYQEEEDTNFLKSFFLVGKEILGDYKDLDKEVVFKEIDKNLKMLVDTNSLRSLSNRYYLIPNMKIMQKHSNVLSKFTFTISNYEASLKDVRHLITNTILSTIVKSILQQMFNAKQGANLYFRFTMLVPNIYDYFDIKFLLQNLQDIFKEYATNIPNGGKLLGWEIDTISESDAALIGYMNKQNAQVLPNSDNLIIDIGKGTTDFSIVKTGNNINTITPIYRNGFAGAGNLITYAMFETLIHFIRENSSDKHGADNWINKNIINALKGNDLVVKNELFTQIEKLKFNFNEDTTAVKVAWLNAKVLSDNYELSNIVEKDLDVNALIKLLDKINNGADFYNYIQQAMQVIIDGIVEHIILIRNNKKDFKPGKIIFTGRGFLFKPLLNGIKQALINTLQVHENSIETLSNNDLKTICMKGVFNTSILLNTDSVGYPIQVSTSANTEPAPTPTINTKAITSSLTGFIKKLLALDNEQITKATLVTTGKFDAATLQHSNIIIGAQVYKLANGNFVTPGANYTYTIESTNSDFVVRKMQGLQCIETTTLNECLDQSAYNEEVIIPSLFPSYINIDNIKSLKATLQAKQAAIVPTPQVNDGAIDELMF